MFTLVVPTRNRADTLPDCLETCVAANRDDLRILVSDNKSVDQTREIIEEFKRRDPRVEYISPDKSLSMSLHHEFALDECRDSFVCIVGDDDGLVAGGLDYAAELLKEHPSAKAIAWRQSDYHYPNSPYAKDFGWPSNMLCLASGHTSELRNAAEVLRDSLNGEVEYVTLPGTYHSFTHTSVLEQIRQQSKGPHWINDPCPDLYVFVAAALLDIPHVYTQRSITIRGASQNSTGAAFAAPSGNEKLKADFLAAEYPLVHPDWDCPQVTPIPIVHACLARSLEAGIRDIPHVIDWDNVLVRLVQDLKSRPPGFLKPEVLAFVESVANRVGKTAFLNEIKDLDLEGLAARAKRKPEGPPRQHFLFDSVSEMSNIHDACRFAGLVYDAPEAVPFMMSSLQRIQELHGGHAENLKQQAEIFSAKIAALENKNTQLRTKSDDLKEQLAKTKLRHQELKQKLANSRIYKSLEKLGIIR